MALAPRDFPLTRETVYEWLMEYNGLDSKPPIKTYLAGKINALNLPDTMIDTAEHEDLDAQTSALDMVMSDLPSYGIPYQ